MDVKKAVRKIIALGTGATMVGATLFGAMAADLSNYPAPFVENGVWNALIVIGDTAKPIDIIGANNLLPSLQAAAVGGVASDGGATTVTTFGEGVLIEAPGNDFKYSVDIADIQSQGFDEEDLPEILADGEYKESKGDTQNDESYTQNVDFAADFAELVVEEDKNSDDDAAGTYLKLTDGSTYAYELKFDNAIEYVAADNAELDDDFEGSKLEILGKSYTVVDAKLGAANRVGEITLITGSVPATQDEYSTQSYVVDGVNYEVEVIVISAQAGGTVKFKVNGETTDALNEGDTYRLDDEMEIGVDEIIENEGTEAGGEDIVSFYLGARKLELVGDGVTDVKINGQEIDDDFYTATAVFTVADNELTEIIITVEMEDDIWLAEGDEWVEPVFGAWKLINTGLSKSVETIEIDTDDEDGTLTFTNNDGKEVEIPFVADGAGALDWGEDADLAALSATGGVAFADGQLCTGVADADECDDFLFLVTSDGHEAALFEIDNIDETTLACNIKDLTNNKVYDSDTNVVCDGTPIETDLGDIAITIVAAAAHTVTFDTIDIAGDGYFETDKGAELAITNGAASMTLELTPNDDLDTQIVTIELALDNDIEINNAIVEVVLVDEDDDSDYKIGVDSTDGNADGVWGVFYRLDVDSDQNLVIEYPEDEVIANIYLVPAAAVGTTSAAGGAVVINLIPAGATVLASATTLGAENQILIGGPCVNSLSAEFKGNPAVCAEGFEEGKAIIELKDVGEKVVMLVAGYSGADTGNAITVLASGVALSGSAVEVDAALQVSAPTVAPAGNATQ